MTPPNVIFVPAAAAVKYSIAGTLASGSTSARRDLTGESKSGDDAATLSPYASGDFMVNQNIRIDLWFDVSGMTGPDYATQIGGSPTATITADGVSMDVSVINIVTGSTYIKFELSGSDSEGSWFASNCSVGNSFEFTLNY